MDVLCFRLLKAEAKRGSQPGVNRISLFACDGARERRGTGRRNGLDGSSDLD